MVNLFRRALFLFAAGQLCFGVPHTPGADAPLKKLRVGYPSHSASMYPIYVTKEAKLFEKYGLDGEMIYVQGVQMVQVHVAGQLDVTTTSGLVTLQSSVSGADLILLANSIDIHLMKLTAHPSINGPADLKGKSIAVTRFGSLTDLVVRPLVDELGTGSQKRRDALANRHPARHRHGDLPQESRRRRALLSDVLLRGKNRAQSALRLR